MKTIIIIGATSGIGLAVAKEFMNKGYLVGGCGRRGDILNKLENEFPGKFFGQVLDISQPDTIPDALNSLIKKTGEMDLCLVSSSISESNHDFLWDIENSVIQINVTGYTAVLNFAIHYFIKKGSGHLAGITSIAQFIGSKNPVYSASKVFESNYLEGLRLKFAHKNILITDIIPGFVQTQMIANRKKLFWIVPLEKAGRQIVKGLEAKKQTIYISKRWRLVKWFIKLIPSALIRQILISQDQRG